MKKTALYVAILAVLSVSCVPEGSQKQAQRFEVQRFHNVRIPMRDGIELAANISRPKAEDKFPVILVRTPYGKGKSGKE